MGSWQGKTFTSTPCSFPDSLTLFSRSSTPLGQQDLTDHPACWGTPITVTHSGCWGPARLAWAAQPEDRGRSLGSTSPPGPRCGLVSFLLGCQGLQAGMQEREAAPPFQGACCPRVAWCHDCGNSLLPPSCSCCCQA